MYTQNERDLSVRQRAVDLLYAMCDRDQAEEIVGELLAYLEKADYSIREELVRSTFMLCIVIEVYIVNLVCSYTSNEIKFCACIDTFCVDTF